MPRTSGCSAAHSERWPARTWLLVACRTSRSRAPRHRRRRHRAHRPPAHRGRVLHRGARVSGAHLPARAAARSQGDPRRADPRGPRAARARRRRPRRRRHRKGGAGGSHGRQRTARRRPCAQPARASTPAPAAPATPLRPMTGPLLLPGPSLGRNVATCAQPGAPVGPRAPTCCSIADSRPRGSDFGFATAQASPQRLQSRPRPSRQSRRSSRARPPRIGPRPSRWLRRHRYPNRVDGRRPYPNRRLRRAGGSGPGSAAGPASSPRAAAAPVARGRRRLGAPRRRPHRHEHCQRHRGASAEAVGSRSRARRQQYETCASRCIFIVELTEPSKINKNTKENKDETYD